MIPKVIHYCWFGGNPLDELAKKCIESWKKFCPDYEIIEWNENNFDINCCDYVKEAYDAGKWAFLTDYARLKIVYEQGGLYFDTDVELIRPIDDFLNCKAFFGFQSADAVATGLGFGAKKGCDILQELMLDYNGVHFLLPDGEYDLTPCPLRNTKVFVKYGLKLDDTYQNLKDILFYPSDYFCPKSYANGEINLTDNTVSIHHFNASWRSERQKVLYEKRKYFTKKYGEDRGNKKFEIWRKFMALFLYIKYEGLGQTLNKVFLKVKVILKIVLLKIFSIFFKIFPLRNIIMFECESDMDDNPRAVYDYLLKCGLNKKYKIIWVVRDGENCKKLYSEKNVYFVERVSASIFESIKLKYYCAISKYLVFSHPYWFKKFKKNQVVINTHHGTAFKAREKKSAMNSKVYDYILSTSQKSANWVMKFWGAEKEQIANLGYPRNDLLFSPVSNKEINKLFSFEPNDKLIISMTTYRQCSGRSDCDIKDKFCINVIETIEDLQKFNNFLKERHYHYVIKVHPLQSLDFLEMVNLSNIHYITNKELFLKKIQLYKLIGKCDALITDFSSVFFDYLLVNRPIGFFVKDFDNYNRGYIMDNPMDFMPGNKIKTCEELYDFVDHIIENKDLYEADRKKVLDFMDDYKDDKSCERFVNEFFK